MSFKQLTGRQELGHRLGSAIKENRVSHAVLLSGPAGSGKKSWGMALAQAILCLSPTKDGACMKCSSCKLFQSGNHIAFYNLKPASRKIKIEQIRSLRNKFYLSGDKKVCLIDEAEKMTAETASSLLKILEEPPPGLHFILLTGSPELIFDTILSRCQRYNLPPLSCFEIIDLLVKDKDITEERALFFARLSKGLPGYAMQLVDDEEFEKRYNEAKALAVNLSSGQDSAARLLEWASSLAEREDLIEYLELVCLFYHGEMMKKLQLEEEFGLTSLVNESVSEQPVLLGLENAILLINQTVSELTATNVNRRLLLEKMLILMQRRLIACK